MNVYGVLSVLVTAALIEPVENANQPFGTVAKFDIARATTTQRRLLSRLLSQSGRAFRPGDVGRANASNAENLLGSLVCHVGKKVLFFCSMPMHYFDIMFVGRSDSLPLRGSGVHNVEVYILDAGD